MQSKAKHIQIIETLYPPDSDFPDTALIGNKLLMRAMRNTDFHWQDLPFEVLQELSRLCIQENESSNFRNLGSTGHADDMR